MSKKNTVGRLGLSIEERVSLAADNFSSGARKRRIPFFEYVQRCTAPTDRIFIAGDLPEVFVQAQRRFAGGPPALRRGFFDTPADQPRVVSRLRGQRVPLALVVTDGDVSEFPIVMAELETRFERLTTLALRGHTDLVLLGSREIPACGTDLATGGLPCHREARAGSERCLPAIDAPPSVTQL